MTNIYSKSILDAEKEIEYWEDNGCYGFSDKEIDQEVNSFIWCWCSEDRQHLIDNDENQAQELRLWIYINSLKAKLQTLKQCEEMHLKFVEDLKKEPEDKANSAQVFLLNYGCGDLVLNETMPKDKWIYVSDLIILFLKWKLDNLNNSNYSQQNKSGKNVVDLPLRKPQETRNCSGEDNTKGNMPDTADNPQTADTSNSQENCCICSDFKRGICDKHRREQQRTMQEIVSELNSEESK